ncbi:peptidoglycan hydrolase CwlO-like protein [Streptomyces iranensis]|nr:peptidoglycan hydrolase CwlO-like protein [Streptomyces iranensis]
MTNGKITVAVVGGYLLGRTKKAKLAIGLGMLLAGKKISLDPQQLKKSLAQAPLLSGLNSEVRKELADATRQAATKAVSDRVSGLADSLHERTALLRGAGGDEGEDEGEGEGESEEAEAPARPAKKTAASGSGTAKKAAAKKTAAKRPAAERPTAKKTTAKKSAVKRPAVKRPAAKTAKTAGGRNG